MIDLMEKSFHDTWFFMPKFNVIERIILKKNPLPMFCTTKLYNQVELGCLGSIRYPPSHLN